MADKFPPYQRLNDFQRGNVVRGVRRDLAVSRFNDDTDSAVSDTQGRAASVSSIRDLTKALSKKNTRAR